MLTVVNISGGLAAIVVQVHGTTSFSWTLEQHEHGAVSVVVNPFHSRFRSCTRGLRTPWTIPDRLPTFINARQQTSPSRSQLISASLSPVPIPAFCRTSFGSTIWPRSSTLRTASTVQHVPGTHDDGLPGLFFFAMFLVVLGLHIIKIYQKSQSNQTM